MSPTRCRRRYQAGPHPTRRTPHVPGHGGSRSAAYLAVRSPANPAFWWGNFLLLPAQAAGETRAGGSRCSTRGSGMRAMWRWASASPAAARIWPGLPLRDWRSASSQATVTGGSPRRRRESETPKKAPPPARRSPTPGTAPAAVSPQNRWPSRSTSPSGQGCCPIFFTISAFVSCAGASPSVV